MNDLIASLTKMAKERGLQVIERGSGHFQITGGPLLVNYYPGSKKRSAYVAGTTSKKVGVSPQQAVEMAFKAPTAVRKDQRRKSYRGIKLQLLKKSAKCKWCNAKLTMETATLEHIIPLSRGGLDNKNNMALACEPCNKARGSDMPELKQVSQ